MPHTFHSFSSPLKKSLAVAVCCITLSSWSASDATTAPLTYTTKAGDTVERLVQNALSASPLSPAVLRNALAELNPKIVTGKPGQKFKPGTLITLPDHGQLVRNTLAPFADPAPENSTRSGYSAGDPSSRRNWIRYP